MEGLEDVETRKTVGYRLLYRLFLFRREILKQLGVTPSSPPPQEEPLFLPEAPRVQGP